MIELDDPEEYDEYREEGCPTCSGDVGIQNSFGFCENGHLLQVVKGSND